MKQQERPTSSRAPGRAVRPFGTLSPGLHVGPPNRSPRSPTPHSNPRSRRLNEVYFDPDPDRADPRHEPWDWHMLHMLDPGIGTTPGLIGKYAGPISRVCGRFLWFGRSPRSPGISSPVPFKFRPYPVSSDLCVIEHPGLQLLNVIDQRSSKVL